MQGQTALWKVLHIIMRTWPDSIMGLELSPSLTVRRYRGGPLLVLVLDWMGLKPMKRDKRGY